MLSLFGLRTRFWAFRQPAIGRLYYTNGGLGDELMMTAIVAAARAAGKPINVIATYPEMWRSNSDAASIQQNLARWEYATLRGWLNTSVIHLSYTMGRNRSIAEQMAEHAEISLPTTWRPILPALKIPYRQPRRIVFQNSCQGALYAASTKEWSQDRWEQLAARLKPDYELIQIGTLSDPLVPSATDYRGQTSFLQAAELIASAQLFIGLESGLMHVAAAVHTPAVIIVGGRSLAQETCYPFNHNITRTPACVGCGLNTDCPNNLICLDIPVKTVELAARSLLALPPSSN